MLSTAAALLVAISSVSAQLVTSGSIQAVVSSNSALTQLNSLLVENTAALSALAIPNAHTVFAPTNEAFNAFYTSNPNANASVAGQFLNYHIISGTYPSTALNTTLPFFKSTLFNEAPYVNLNGQAQSIGLWKSPYDGKYYIYNGVFNATIVQTDITFDGGIMHTIDKVLTPPVDPFNTVVQLNYAQMLTYWNSTGMFDMLTTGYAGSTFFVPSDAAFNLVQLQMNAKDTNGQTGVMDYHTINGTVLMPGDFQNGQKLQTSQGGEMDVYIWNGDTYTDFGKITGGPILTSSGVIYTIDALLNPTKAMTNFTGQPPSNSSGGSTATGTTTSDADITRTLSQSVSFVVTLVSIALMAM